MANETKYYLPEDCPRPRAARDGLDQGILGRGQAPRADRPALQRMRDIPMGPRMDLPRCHAVDLGWHQVSGRGRIYSWVRIWNPVHPALKDACPYIVAVVELPDAGNVRMVGNLLGDPHQNPPSMRKSKRSSKTIRMPHSCNGG